MIFFLMGAYRSVKQMRPNYRTERWCNMNAVERMKLYLKEEYGIETEEQLEAAFRKMKPINIGMFVSKPRKVDEAK